MISHTPSACASASRQLGGRSNQRRCSKSAQTTPVGPRVRLGAATRQPGPRSGAPRAGPTPARSAVGRHRRRRRRRRRSAQASGGSTRPSRCRQRPVSGRSGSRRSNRQPSRATSRDGVDDVVGHGVGDEVVEVHPHPAGLDALAAAGDLALELVRALEVDAEQPVAVRARRTSSRRAPGCRTGR